VLQALLLRCARGRLIDHDVLRLILLDGLVDIGGGEEVVER
jgi:hypothetical protein